MYIKTRNNFNNAIFAVYTNFGGVREHSESEGSMTARDNEEM